MNVAEDQLRRLSAQTCPCWNVPFQHGLIKVSRREWRTLGLSYRVLWRCWDCTLEEEVAPGVRYWGV